MTLIAANKPYFFAEFGEPFKSEDVTTKERQLNCKQKNIRRSNKTLRWRGRGEGGGERRKETPVPNGTCNLVVVLYCS